MKFSVLTLCTTLTTIGVATACGADQHAADALLHNDRSGTTREGCISCHQQSSLGFASGHRFGEVSCTPCHGGLPHAGTEQGAHTGLIAFPGNLSNAGRTCGGCHPDHTAAVRNSPMATGAGIVASTRELFSESAGEELTGTLSTLGYSPADSLLRKLCASCHLNQDKDRHVLDATTDRGGGCLACHLNNYPAGAHPALTVRVSDARCFGCHSRSSRISLNYAGIAEVEPEALQRADTSALGRLDDGRLVEFLTPDIHHRAGMACIDCHTSPGTMGMDRSGRGPDILCIDCHGNTSARLDIDQWPEKLEGQIKRIPFKLRPGQKFLTTKRRGTPLGHIEVRDKENIVYLKQSGGSLAVPPWTRQSHPYRAEHRRLSCGACHSTWAPQCYGCHTAYDSSGSQWDHVAKETTPGRWIEKRWNMVAGPPPLGITRHDRVVPVVPGMIMTLDHPQLGRSIFRRRFAAIAPHTIGSARSCDSCHRSAAALGLGQGRLHKKDGRWTFEPALKLLGDGLPADAWTSLNAQSATKPASNGVRPFDTDEIFRILDAVAEPEPTGQQAVHRTAH